MGIYVKYRKGCNVINNLTEEIEQMSKEQFEFVKYDLLGLELFYTKSIRLKDINLD